MSYLLPRALSQPHTLMAVLWLASAGHTLDQPLLGLWCPFWPSVPFSSPAVREDHPAGQGTTGDSPGF